MPQQTELLLQHSINEEPSTKRRHRLTIVFGVSLVLLVLLTAILLIMRFYAINKNVKVRQSPINIITLNAQFDGTLNVEGAFDVDYPAVQDVTLMNSGHGWQIQPDQNLTSNVTASYLPATFRLLQIHAHWGTGSNNGSEHTVDGVGYAAEIHLVHYNTEYTNQEHLTKSDGLAVFGVFLTIADEASSPFDIIAENLDKIQFEKDSIILKDVKLRSMFPKDKSEYWTYEGSLTTPPFSECVIWTVLKRPLSVSSSTIEKFRSFKIETNEDGGQEYKHDKHVHHEERRNGGITGLVRAVQPINRRMIKSSFEF